MARPDHAGQQRHLASSRRPFIPKLVDRFGKKTIFQWCGLFTVVGGLALFFTPAGAIAPALIFLGIKGIGAALINTVMFGLEADTVEYGEWKSGKRSEGATYAVFSFTRKITQSIGGAVGAAALAFGGYLSATAAVPNPVQPESAILAIRVTIGLLPAIVALIAMAIFWKYPLTDQRFREIRNETSTASASRATSSRRTVTSSTEPVHDGWPLAEREGPVRGLANRSYARRRPRGAAARRGRPGPPREPRRRPSARARFLPTRPRAV